MTQFSKILNQHFLIRNQLVEKYLITFFSQQRTSKLCIQEILMKAFESHRVWSMTRQKVLLKPSSRRLQEILFGKTSFLVCFIMVLLRKIFRKDSKTLSCKILTSKVSTGGFWELERTCLRRIVMFANWRFIYKISSERQSYSWKWSLTVKMGKFQSFIHTKEESSFNF